MRSMIPHIESSLVLFACSFFFWGGPLATLGCSQQLGWEESRFSCDSDAQCASGWRCVQGVCSKGSVEPDTDLAELEVEQELLDVEVETLEELDELDLEGPDEEADDVEESDELEVSKCTDCYPWQRCDEDSGECVGQCGVGTDCGTISGTFAGQICSATWECADCADATACTNSAYPPGTLCVNGRCVVSSCTQETNGFPCDDNDPCTTGERCENAVCAGAPLCWELNCTAGSCEGSVGLAWSQTASPITSLDVSMDGRFLTFVSRSQFGPPAEYNRTQVFRYDQLLGELLVLSLDHVGEPGNFDCKEPSISDDGCLVAFSTKAALLTFDTNGTSDVYVWDCASRSLTVVGQKFNDDAPGNGDSQQPRLSGNGEYVVFASTTSDFVASDPNGSVQDVFRWKRSDGSMTLLSRSFVPTDGANGASENPVVSATGDLTAFVTTATNLSSTTPGTGLEHLVRHRDEALTYYPMESRTIDHFSQLELSADGLVLAYQGQTGQQPAQLYVIPRVTEGIQASLGFEGESGNQSSERPRLSDDGERLVFTSSATNLVSNGTPAASRVYLWEREAQPPLRWVEGAIGTDAIVSGDGRFVFFVLADKGQHQIVMGALDHAQ